MELERVQSKKGSVQSSNLFSPSLVSSYQYKSTTAIVESIAISGQKTSVYQQICLNMHKISLELRGHLDASTTQFRCPHRAAHSHFTPFLETMVRQQLIPSLLCSKGHERMPSDKTECTYVDLLNSECNLECGYLHCIVIAFLNNHSLGTLYFQIHSGAMLVNQVHALQSLK